MSARPNHLSLTPEDGGRLVTVGTPTSIGQGNYQRKVNWRRVDDYEQRREGWFFFDPDDTDVLQARNAITANPALSASAPPPPSSIGSSISLYSKTWIPIGTFSGTVHSRSHTGTVYYNQANTLEVIVGYAVSGVWSGPGSGKSEFLWWINNVLTGTVNANSVNGQYSNIITLSTGNTILFGLGWNADGNANASTDTLFGSTFSYTPPAAGTHERILFIGECVRPNLERKLVVATKTRIFAFDSNTQTWATLKSGFTDDERAVRWQHAILNGYLVLNNGYDLPHTIRVEEGTAEPIKELREIGVARVGFITENNGYLMGYDVTYIKTAELAGVMNGASPYGPVTDNSKVERVAYDCVWGEYAQPRKWAPVVSVVLNSSTASFALPFLYSGWTVGTKMAVVNGGPNGGILGGQEATPDGIAISGISGTTVTLAQVTDASISYPRTVQLMRYTDLSTLAGKASLQDDSSEIVAVKPFNGKTHIYRKTGIFRATYTGLSTKPFDFKPIYRGPNVPLWRDAIADVDGKYHLYPGFGNRFYYFDGVNEPELHRPSDLARTVLFDTPGLLPNSDVFAIDNRLTKEIWFVHADGGTGSALAFDYVKNTAAEIEFNVCGMPTAAAAIIRPKASYPDDWFVLAFDNPYDGTLHTYGLCHTGQVFRTFLRNGAQGANYLIEGALGAWNDRFNEKDLVGYVLHLELPDGGLGLGEYDAGPTATVEVTTCNDERQTPSTPFTAVALYGPYKLDLYARAIFFKDKVTLSFAAEEYLTEADKDFEIRLIARTWERAPLRTRSTPRGQNQTAPWAGVGGGGGGGGGPPPGP